MAVKTAKNRAVRREGRRTGRGVTVALARRRLGLAAGWRT